jgi:hypothetical protein
MRQILVCSVILLLATLAFSQQAPILNYGPDYGPCLACGPNIPLITTPSISLQAPPVTVGASNATEGLVAGAANATVSTISAYPGAGYAAPIGLATAEFAETAASVMPAGTELEPAHPRTQPNIFFTPLDQTASAGAASAEAKNLTRRAARTYTNADIDQFNQLNGTVKYRGKTVHME